MGVNSDMTTYNLFTYCGNNPIIRYDVGGMRWKNVIDWIIHTVNNFAVSVGIDTAAIGAAILMMEKDLFGVYHADFDCWQQYFGYNVVYDIVFDIGTSMIAAEFPFYYGGSGYTVWAWKGDYVNLGAGAELGIYRGASGQRFVDKSLAMNMGMIVTYHNNGFNEYVLRYFPDEPQWWITGFNPDFQNVDAKQLRATIFVRFSDAKMYAAFKGAWGVDSRLSFYDYICTAIVQF